VLIEEEIMEYFTIRIIRQDGNISLSDYTFSQVVKLLSGVSEDDRNKFWDGQESIVASSGNLKLVNMEKIR